MKTKLKIETPMTDLDDAINKWIESASSEVKETLKTENGEYDIYELTEVIQIIYQQSIIQAYELNGVTQKPQTLRSALIFYR